MIESISTIRNSLFRMDRRNIKFDWNRARAFLVTAEEGSLAAAARALELTQPTLGRQVAALEKELGVDLFFRVGRGLELTPNGMKLVEHVRAMGDAADLFSLSALGESDNLDGKICISTTELMAAYVMPPIVRKLRQEEPGIEIEIISSNEETNLIRREADIAIRSFRPKQHELVTKKLADLSGHLYASGAYLEFLGHPKTISDLNKADYIDVEASGRLLRFLNSQGFGLTERNFPVVTKSHIVQWELVKLGAAITVTLDSIGDAEPLVKRIEVPEFTPFSAEVWIVTHQELRSNKRIRTVFDFLVAELAN